MKITLIAAAGFMVGAVAALQFSSVIWGIMEKQMSGDAKSLGSTAK